MTKEEIKNARRDLNRVYAWLAETYGTSMKAVLNSMEQTSWYLANLPEISESALKTMELKDPAGVPQIDPNNFPSEERRVEINKRIVDVYAKEDAKQAKEYTEDLLRMFR